MDKHGITIYNTYISIDLEHYAILHAKEGQGFITTTLQPVFSRQGSYYPVARPMIMWYLHYS